MISLEVKIICGIILVVVLGAFGWKVYHDIDAGGYNRRVAEDNAAAAQTFRQNEIKSDKLQAETDATTKEKDDEIRRINARLNVALGELRKRPERAASVPENPRHCEGATGSELSRPDAGFLEGEAARGNELRAGLAECYRLLDRIQAAQPRPVAPN